MPRRWVEVGAGVRGRVPQNAGVTAPIGNREAPVGRRHHVVRGEEGLEKERIGRTGSGAICDYNITPKGLKRLVK